MQPSSVFTSWKSYSELLQTLCFAELNIWWTARYAIQVGYGALFVFHMVHRNAESKCFGELSDNDDF